MMFVARVLFFSGWDLRLLEHAPLGGRVRAPRCSASRPRGSAAP